MKRKLVLIHILLVAALSTALAVSLPSTSYTPSGYQSFTTVDVSAQLGNNTPIFMSAVGAGLECDPTVAGFNEQHGSGAVGCIACCDGIYGSSADTNWEARVNCINSCEMALNQSPLDGGWLAMLLLAPLYIAIKRLRCSKK